MNLKTGALSWQKKSMLLLVCAMLVLVAIPSVSAYTAELTSPSDINNVYNGDTVTIKLTGLAAPNTFQLNLTSSDLKTNGGTFTMTNYNMPFAMNPANVSLTAGNLDSNGLHLYAKGTTATTVDVTNTNSPYTITDSHPIGQMTYSTISITGSPSTSGQAVSMDFSERGTVTSVSADPTYLTFVISNTNSGHLRILVPGASTPLDTTLTLKGTRVVPLDGGDSTSGGSVSPGTKTAAVVAAVPVVAQAVPGQVTQTLAINPLGETLSPYNIATTSVSPVAASVSIPQNTKSLTSASTQITSVTVTPLSATEVTAVTAGTAPAAGVFAIEGAAIECSPAGATFNQPVTISFTLTEAQYATALAKAGGVPANIVIQYFNPTTQSWQGITMNAPSGRTISGTTTHFTVFQVFGLGSGAVSPVSTSAQTYGSLIQETTPPTATVPGAQATQVAPKASPTTTPKSPFVPSIAVIAIVGLVGYFIVSRKQ